MHVARQTSAWLLAAVLLGSVPTSAQDAPPTSALTWLEDPGAFEEALRTEEVVELVEIGTGVTNPSKATLAAGGLVGAFVWKDIKPGIYQGYWESYKAEIAAYELDRLLELNMTPPYVERRIDGELGAAGLWVDNAETWKSMGGPPATSSMAPRFIGKYNWMLIRAKMFHNLIYNKDPNLGNWMVDPAWNLIIIDNSRAFTTDTDERVHKLTRVDRDLWDRFVALDEPTLDAALGEWLTGGEIRAMLERRDAMQRDIDDLVEERGEASVFVRYRVPPPAAPASRTAASDEPADVDLDVLAGRLLDALNENPVVLEGSELSWLGTVVRLAGYSGPHESVASDGLHAGHTYGLVHEEGLMWLARDHTDPEPHDGLAEFVGRRTEVFGITQDNEGVYVIRVSLSRSIS